MPVTLPRYPHVFSVPVRIGGRRLEGCDRHYAAQHPGILSKPSSRVQAGTRLFCFHRSAVAALLLLMVSPRLLPLAFSRVLRRYTCFDDYPIAAVVVSHSVIPAYPLLAQLGCVELLDDEMIRAGQFRGLPTNCCPTGIGPNVLTSSDCAAFSSGFVLSVWLPPAKVG